MTTPTSGSGEAKSRLPKEKQTTLGLYVTAKEAYEKWKADPENVMIVDVRTPEEFLYVGHLAMVWKAIQCRIPTASSMVSGW